MFRRWAQRALSTTVIAAPVLAPGSALAATHGTGTLIGVTAGVAAVAVAALAAGGFLARRRLGRLMRDNARLREDAARRDIALSRAPAQYCFWPSDGTAEEVSPGLAALVGNADGGDVGFDDVRALFAAADSNDLARAVTELRDNGTRLDRELHAADGRRTLRLTGARSAGADDGAAVVWIVDETSHVAARDRLAGEAGKLRALLDSVPVPVWRRGRDLRIDFANRAYAEAVEADPDADPATLPELAAGGGAEQGRSLAERVLAEGAGQSLEEHIVIGGSRRLIALNEVPLGDSAVAGFALDRTEIEDVRSELSRHIGGHENVLENMATAIAIYAADESLTFFNRAFLRLWRLDEQWLDGHPPLGEVLEKLRDDRRLPEAANFPAFKAEQRKRFTSLLEPIEELVHLPDGTTLRSVVTPHPFGGLLFTWEDVTDALAMERSYNTLTAVQRETLDNLYEGVAAIGGDGRLRLSNPAFARMWQIPEDVLAGKPHISDLVERMRDFLDEEGDWPSVKQQITEILTDREGRTGRMERSDGSVLDYATVPRPAGAVLLSYLDVSDSDRVERALRERNEALETADRLKSEFIANVSYELRTPLNTIIGFAEILAGLYFGELNQRQQEYSNGILLSSHQLLSLINDILDLATIEAGHMALEPRRTDLRELLSGVIALSREPMRKKNLSLELDCPEDIGEVVIDEKRIRQACFSILSNAVKFTPEDGSISVAARRDGDMVVLTFSDNGVGIDESEQSRMFLKFERGKNAEARQAGAGLGLSLVKSFVELHGGRVELDSKPGVGTTVSCILPAEYRAAAE